MSNSAWTPRIGTFNAMLLPRLLYPGWGARERARLVVADGLLSGLDAVVLQEGYDRVAAGILADGLRAEYPHRTPWVGRGRRGWDETIGHARAVTPVAGGVAIVSRWPLRRRVQGLFAAAAGADRFARKGFALASIDAPAGVIHLLGAHTQADGTGARPERARAVRAAQFGEIRRALDGIAAPPEETRFVAGDLNVIAGTDEETAMLGTLGAQRPERSGPDSFDTARNTMAASPFGGTVPEHLDYVLALDGPTAPTGWRNTTLARSSSAWAGRRGRQYTDYSDHYPVIGSVPARGDATG